MISIDRKLRLKDLEIFRFIRDYRVLAYAIIEDTRGSIQKKTKS